MAILIYQLVIVGTLLLTRALAPGSLAKACLIWSALTVINVFWPPLIALQLLVVWITFALLKPPEAGPARGSANDANLKRADAATLERKRDVVPNRQTQAPAPVRDAQRTIRTAQTRASEPATKGVLNSVVGFVSDLDDYVSFESAVQEATSSILSACKNERMYFEIALESVTRRLRIDTLSADNPLFANNYNDILKALKEDRAGQPSTPEPKVLCTDFKSLPHSDNPEVDRAIEARVEKELNEYARVLADTQARVSTEKMQKYFDEEMRKLNAEDLLARFRCFMLDGMDWRSIADVELCTGKNYDFMLGLVQTLRAKPKPALPSSVAPKPFRGVDWPSECDFSGEIKRMALAMNIPFLVHFTQASNLQSILRNGLHSIASARHTGLHPHLNDEQRLDGYPEAASVSIAFPNYPMFYKYRTHHRDRDWVVLLIDPSVLWKKRCGFCERNAADHRMRARPLESIGNADAFRRMFAPLDDKDSRERQQLHDYDPTDPQAEVLVFDVIEPDFIKGVMFDNYAVKGACSMVLGDREWKVFPPDTGPFGQHRNKAGWRD